MYTYSKSPTKLLMASPNSMPPDDSRRISYQPPARRFSPSASPLAASRIGARRSLGSAGSSSARLLSTSLVGSTGEILLSDGRSNSQVPQTPHSEALSSSVERLARRMRHVLTQEARQRALLVEEAYDSFGDILRRHVAYLEFAKSCVDLITQRTAQAEAEAQRAQYWRLQVLRDKLRETMREETARRSALEQAELGVRVSMARLQRAEALPQQRREAFFRVMHAEHVRRAFLLREEARAVEVMGIPGFISFPCHFTHADIATALPGSAAGRGTDVTLSKIDLMAQQRCPFLCAADCPYIAPRTRQLGELWAQAVLRGEETRASLATRGIGPRSASPPSGPPRPSRLWQAAVPTITEVGKQRVRNVMLVEHYSATTHFLPALRLS